ncbi:MAG: hypothetical protein JRG91_01880 [Deltaproteobacteria bacterium]|nr:hypothetical protein [Deltaproteobacteria bacterium]
MRRAMLAGFVLLLMTPAGSCDPGRARQSEVQAASMIQASAAKPKKKKSKAGFTKAQYKKHVKKLKKTVPEGFTVLLQEPFVVIGDEHPATVKKRSKSTVKWTVDRLKEDFFSKDPKHIIDIWLFKDDASYMKHAKEIFGDVPDTPYGYYSEEHRALVMNIATGGGTLVHEIVHPFMDSNFPACPPWFNEGLGSLYEQCMDSDGHIWGLTNWRLAGLQEAVQNDEVPSFKKLTSMDENQFYNEDKGTNYSQSRYLLLYLQEKGLLVDYYHAFRENADEDPDGYETLEKTLGVDDMAAFKVKWESWVLALTFP